MAQSMNKFIIAVVVIGVTLIMGIFIAASIQDATKASSTAGTVTNETGAFINSTGYTLAQAGLEDFAGATITIAYNRTSGLPIAAGNYTLTNNVLTNATAVTWDNVSVSYTYSYTAATDTSDAAGDLVTSLSGGSAWVTILIVVGFATIVLGMLTQGLGRKEQEMESGYVY